MNNNGNDKKTLEIVKKATSTVVNGIGRYAGEALSACEASRAAADIRAKGELYNLERRAMREMPKVVFNPAQEKDLLFPEYRGQGAYIQLDHSQAEQVFRHMLEQHALDPDSKAELVSMVTPKVGVPNMAQAICISREWVATSWVVPTLNQIRLARGLPTIDNYNVNGNTLYQGTNEGVRLIYNACHYEDAKKLCEEYKIKGRYTQSLMDSLKKIGIEIQQMKTKGCFLVVCLKWTGV